MTKKVMTVGAAIVDLYVESSEFRIERRDGGVYLCQAYGAKLEMDNFEVRTGGGANNVATGLARLGLEATIISELGQDIWSTIILSELQRENVRTDFVIRERLETTGKAVILLGSDGGRTVIVDRGASALLDGYDIPVARIAEMDWLHFSSVNGAESAIKKVLRAMEVVKGVGFSWNPGSGELKMIAEGKVTFPQKFNGRAVFLANKEEWEVVEKQQAEIKAVFDLVVVTDGERGGKVFGRELREDLDFEAGGAEKVIDATGAGDAFATGLIFGLLEEKNLEQAVAWGVKNATSVIGAIGAKTNLLKKNEL